MEIGDARIPPPLGLLLLNCQERGDLLVARRIDVSTQARPHLAHLGDALHSGGVVAHQLVPERASRGHSIIPGQVMEPEQQCFRRALQTAKFRGDLGCVLRHRVAAARGPIKANALRVGAVVVDRGPIGVGAACHPRSRTVVMTLGHLVMQAQRRHVVHHRLARAHHHRDYRRDECGIVGERHAHPFLGDCRRRQGWIPRETAEGVPVSLIEMRAAPVAVRTDVGDAGDASARITVQRAVDHLSNGGVFSPHVSV